MIRLIVSDIDGTLTDEGSSYINPEYSEVISRLCDKGFIFCIASGRQFTSVKNLLAPVADRIFYIMEGGGVLRSYQEIYHIEPLPQEYLLEFLEDCRNCPETDRLVAAPDMSYSETGDTPMFRLLTNSYGFDMTNLDSLNHAPLDQIVKLSVFHETDVESACNQTLIPKWNDKFQITCSGRQWIDCLSLNTSKGNALKQLQKRLGITKDETMVFGDNMNDISMLQQAKYSYAVGNARDEVKKAAAFTTDTYMNNGVLKELKKLL